MTSRTVAAVPRQRAWTGPSTLIASIAIVLATPAAGQQTTALPDNVVEGFNAVRIENEIKLAVPDADVEALWRYLEERYRNGVVFRDGEHEHRFATSFASEHFLDVYFDTRDKILLSAQSGVRHRTRTVTGDVEDGEVRELVQIKLNRPGETVARTEIKFPVRHLDIQSSIDDRHPLLGLVDRNYRQEFMQRLREVGVDPWDLHRALTIQQVRRRVYVMDENGAFATFTLDQTSAARLWLRTAFTEIELELNEIRYTRSSGSERQSMVHVNELIKADILSEFPGVEQDQTPKYNKAYAGLEASSAWGPVLLRANFTRDQLITAVLFGILAAFGVFVSVRRRFGPAGSRASIPDSGGAPRKSRRQLDRRTARTL